MRGWCGNLPAPGARADQVAPEMLEGLEHLDLVCLDDIEKVSLVMQIGNGHCSISITGQLAERLQLSADCRSRITTGGICTFKLADLRFPPAVRSCLSSCMSCPTRKKRNYSNGAQNCTGNKAAKTK